MATARYMLQHHEVPHTDVFSYTSRGEVWRYPPFAGLVFYLVQMITGYAGLTWLCSLSLVALVSCLLRPASTRGSITTAALAILAIPILARRMSPHPDLFTHLFFTIFLVQIWRFHRGDQNWLGSTMEPGTVAAAHRDAVLGQLPSRVRCRPRRSAGLLYIGRC